MNLFDPHKKFIQSNNEKNRIRGPSLVANIMATYYIINTFFSYYMLKYIIKLFMIM